MGATRAWKPGGAHFDPIAKLGMWGFNGRMSRWALLLLLPLSALGGPGFGPPLNLTTGMVYRASSVAGIEKALAAANGTGLPATLLIADGTYVRVVEQQSVLELDRRGNIWLALSLLDLSPYSDLETPFRCRMINIKTGERYLFPPQAEGNLDLLTMREKEILHLISKGLVSREIADLLFISVNTVNTHRQNIIEKLEVSNTSEAVRYALDLGILAGA